MSDHFSGPAVLGDPAVDITDFYAFPSPERPGHLVLVMDVFPLATRDARFSDVLTHRFRLRPLARSEAGLAAGSAEYVVDVTFDEAPAGKAQRGRVATSDGHSASFTAGVPRESEGLRVFAGLVSDPFFMDVEATLRTDMSGRLSFDSKVNTAQGFDALAIVVEIPLGPIVSRFAGATLVGAIAETVVTRRGRPIRLERVGRPEVKNVLLANPMRDTRARGVELRDLYNREDAFALSPAYGPLYASRLDANLAFFDTLDNKSAWPLQPDGRHPLRDIILADYLVLDLARPFSPGGFLEIERALADSRPHETAGGRWLDEDILDALMTWIVNGSRGPRVGDGVDAPTRPAARTFPYVREPNQRTDLALPAFLAG